VFYKEFEPFRYDNLNTQKLIRITMRKLTFDFYPNETIREVQKPIFKDIYSYELLEMLRIDYEEGVKIGLLECLTKESIPIDDVKLPDYLEILSVLKSKDDKHICIVKVRVPKEFTQMLTEFKLDLIWTTPTLISEKKLVYSCIGDQKNLTKFIEIMKNYGEIVNMRFPKAAYQEHDILSVLTEKQREVLIAAHEHGYYDYPKKINSERLSEKVNISKATLVQHLRKAEGRLLANILAGY
jgi:predicted DNA binding protein